ASQRIAIPFVQAMDFIAVIAVVTDQHPRAERPHGGEFFDCEPNGLRCCGEATIAKPLPRTTLALGGETFGRWAVGKRHDLAFAAAKRRGSAVTQCDPTGFP